MVTYAGTSPYYQTPIRNDYLDIYTSRNIPLDDKDAYLIFANANTTAVFQFESVGMKKMLKEIS